MKGKTLQKRTCLRCLHSWVPRKGITVVCPKCRSPYWNVPKKAVQSA